MTATEIHKINISIGS